MEIEFYWDPSSTNTYFAWHLLKPIASSIALKSAHEASIWAMCFDIIITP